MKMNVILKWITAQRWEEERNVDSFLVHEAHSEFPECPSLFKKHPSVLSFYAWINICFKYLQGIFKMETGCASWWHHELFFTGSLSVNIRVCLHVCVCVFCLSITPLLHACRANRADRTLCAEARECGSHRRYKNTHLIKAPNSCRDKTNIITGWMCVFFWHR